MAEQHTSASDDFLACLEQHLIDHGVDQDVATAAAVAVGIEWGGQTIYIRLRGPYLKRAVLNAFNGHNVPELSRTFRLSRSRIYSIISEAHKARQRDNQQARLPGVGG